MCVSEVLPVAGLQQHGQGLAIVYCPLARDTLPDRPEFTETRMQPQQIPLVYTSTLVSKQPAIEGAQRGPAANRMLISDALFRKQRRNTKDSLSCTCSLYCANIKTVVHWQGLLVSVIKSGVLTVCIA